MAMRGFRRGEPKGGADADGVATDTRGFDDFELRLGDIMRGERATLGKSLLDVQRELKIKAAYIAAIENADPSAFDTPGFIAGYVRSYARFLHLDPDWAFETFCRESGFATTHGMSRDASAARRPPEPRQLPPEKDIFASPSTPFVPGGDTVFSGVEPRALGSIAVLLVLIGGLGYGGWSVLQEVQKVRLAPVEQAPTVLAEMDPLAGGAREAEPGAPAVQAGIAAPSVEALDRLYRPQALDLPVMEARDAPISTLDPRRVGTLVPDLETAPPEPRLAMGPDVARSNVREGEVEIADAVAAAMEEAVPGSGVQVTEAPAPAVTMVAVRPAWVRVRAPDGSVIYEAIMGPGDTFTVPQTEEPATARIGESGAVYFMVNGAHYGPVGPSGSVTSDVALSPQALTGAYEVADIQADQDLARTVAELRATD